MGILQSTIAGGFEIQVRWMIRRDLEAVLRIEQESFELPWTEEQIIQELRAPNCIGMVAEAKDESVVGYMLYELNKHYLRLMSLAVAPHCRRRYVGTRLVERLRSRLVTHPTQKRIVAGVFESNVAAQLFLRNCGFRCVGTINDVYVMRYVHSKGNGS